jgi:hypothetical protein
MSRATRAADSLTYISAKAWSKIAETGLRLAKIVHSMRTKASRQNASAADLGADVAAAAGGVPMRGRK